MTVGELKKLYPQASYRLSSLPDLPSVVAVSEGSENLFYFLAVPQSEHLPSDEAVIQLLVTGNSRYKTDLGIGPESDLPEVVRAYGAVKVYYSSDAEYAQFSKQPNSKQSGMSFWLQPPTGEKTAGKYSWKDVKKNLCVEAKSGFCESEDFKSGSKLRYIAIGGRY
ncbi:MAG: hypothetical protein F6K24_48715 [Okeania sp. SIO2D1]|nr:hypothetical protein [Okeania sp. SIO2D1]